MRRNRLVLEWIFIGWKWFEAGGVSYSIVSWFNLLVSWFYLTSFLQSKRPASSRCAFFSSSRVCWDRKKNTQRRRNTNSQTIASSTLRCTDKTVKQTRNDEKKNGTKEENKRYISNDFPLIFGRDSLTTPNEFRWCAALKKPRLIVFFMSSSFAHTNTHTHISTTGY